VWGAFWQKEDRVSNEAVTIALTTGGAIVVAAIGALVGAAVNSRAKIDEGLREQRLAVYPQLWALTSFASTWPRQDPSWQELDGVHRSLRHWYYGTGGMYMSERTRELYGDVQQLLAEMVRSRADVATHATADEYKDLEERCSGLRAALTQDLETRSAKPFWNLCKRWRRRHWYLEQKSAAKQSIVAATDAADQRAAAPDIQLLPS
jgi:hypothetical protein